jgi:hypothetical protein
MMCSAFGHVSATAEREIALALNLSRAEVWGGELLSRLQD